MKKGRKVTDCSPNKIVMMTTCETNNQQGDTKLYDLIFRTRNHGVDPCWVDGHAVLRRYLRQTQSTTNVHATLPPDLAALVR